MLLLKMEPEIGNIQMSAEKADVMANYIAEEYFKYRHKQCKRQSANLLLF